MKLINSIFDSKVLDDRMYDKRERIRVARPIRYRGEPGILDFEQAENELERTIGDAYRTERTYQPRKQKMRMRWARGRKACIEWWDERPGGAGRDNWHIIDARIDGHIKKWVGRKFDDCFSDLKRKFYENKDWRMQACGIGCSVHKNTRVLWMSIQDRFLDNFEGRWADYGVDDDGIIYDTSKPRRKPRRDIVLYGNGELYWETNVRNLEACRYLFENLPSNIYNAAMVNCRVDNNTILRIEREIKNSARIAYNGTRYDNVEFHKLIWMYMPLHLQSIARRSQWTIAHAVIDFCFTKVDAREHIVLKFGTPEYKRYKAEKNKRRPNPDKAAYYDRSLWVQNYIKKHGGNFHELLTNNPDDITRANFLEALETILNAPGYYAELWGVSKPDLKDACRRLADSNWYKRNWVRNSNIANQFMVAELIYIIKNK